MRSRPGRAAAFLAVCTVAVAAGLSACSGSDAAAPSAPSAASAATSASSSVSASASSRSVAAQRVHVGGKPCGVLVTPSTVWTSAYADGTLVAVDRATGAVRTTVEVGSQPCGLARGAGSIWVEDYGSSELTRVDERTGRVLSTTAVGASPYDVTYGAGAAWVSDNLEGTVSRVDARTGRRTAISTGGNPVGIVYAGGAVWVGLGTTEVARIDPRTSKVTDRLVTAAGAGWTAAAGDDLWVMNGAAGSVSHVDTRRRTVVRTVQVGPNPLDGDAAQGAVWVPLKDGRLVRLDAATDRVTGSWPTGVGNPFVVSAGAGQVWTADFVGTDLVRLDIPAGG